MVLQPVKRSVCKNTPTGKNRWHWTTAQPTCPRDVYKISALFTMRDDRSDIINRDLWIFFMQ